MVEISEIKSRAEAINLSLKTLARAAGVDPSTVYKAAAGNGDTRGRTLRKLIDTLAAREDAMTRHLLSLPHIRDAIAAADKITEAA